MKKIRIIAILLIMTVCSMCAMTACQNKDSDNKDNQTETLPVGTFLGGNETIDQVTEALKNAGLSNTDIFKEWVLDFAETAGKNAELQDRWMPLNDLKYDISKTSSGWTNHHDFSDANCRLTAFLLLEKLLSFQSLEENYKGTYLMFDVADIDKIERYEIHKGKKSQFTTLFGDITVPEGKEPKDALGERWAKYGIKIDSEKVSLLSVVVYDGDFRTAFVGHTGVLIDMGEYMLFVEKIAFEQPYQATKVRDMDELLKMLSQRPEYFGEEGEQGPYIYVNGKYISELKK